MKGQDECQALELAIAAIRQGNKTEACALIHAMLDEVTPNLVVRSWVYQVATSPAECIRCLKQIFSINPVHEPTRHYLAQLEDETLPAILPNNPSASHTTQKGVPTSERGPLRTLADLLLLPLAWALQLPPAGCFFLVLAVVLVGGFVYFRTNTDFFGLAVPDFDALAVSDSYERIEADDLYWRISFQGKDTAEFAGVVRHVSPIRMDKLRILTHDVLVTSGDYADPSVVSTSVINHHFRWRASGTTHVNGRINLLHTVPANEAIYRQLVAVRKWDEVVITGREIKAIETYRRDDRFLLDWRDSGCNTILVESISIVGE
jgi:hypothetical protein